MFLSTRNIFNLKVIPDFLKTNESNLIIFGCIDGKFFEHYFERHQEYDEEETRLMKIIKSRESIDEWASISKDWITVSVPYTVIAEQD